MGIRKVAALAAGAVSTGLLKHVLHRPAANFPGKLALYLDPGIIGGMAGKLGRGSIIVVGTNGKTTTTNLLADALEASGQRVVCNRTGANLDSGVATALMHAGPSDWGVFESDELWLAKVLPHLKSDYVLLLNLFRDQLDRVGEIDAVQASIVGALRKSPGTVLLYNADDPLCTAIADAAPNKAIAFGLARNLGLAQNTVADAQMCQRCEGMLEYAFRQYGQLGDFHCDTCGFGRHSLDFAGDDVRISPFELSLAVLSGGVEQRLEAPFGGAYMAYNLLACAVAAVQLGIPPARLQQAIDAFDPQNGRLQRMRVGGHDVLLNLAKNPIGFNQNLKLVAAAQGRVAAAFFINDKEADGHDISWIWDVDFEELAGIPGLVCFAGGIRRNDLQLRLKYAGVQARLVDSAQDVLDACASLPDDFGLYFIANYTALPAVRETLMRSSTADGVPRQAIPSAPVDTAPSPCDTPDAPTHGGPPPGVILSGAAEGGVVEGSRNHVTPSRPLCIVHVFPELLNLYGDGGNPKVLLNRCLWRGIPAQVVAVSHGQAVDFARADIVFLGGGPDREQRLASEALRGMRDELATYVEDDGVLLAICGGYQILGHEWLLADETMPGLGIVDVSTRRVEGAARIIDNIVIDSPFAECPVVGFENHAGRTFIGRDMRPFGKVLNAGGHGNNDRDRADGVRYRNVIGTYLHGPLLGKNPEVADHLIRVALERRLGHAVELPPLDDAVELAANAYIVDHVR